MAGAGAAAAVVVAAAEAAAGSVVADVAAVAGVDAVSFCTCSTRPPYRNVGACGMLWGALGAVSVRALGLPNAVLVPPLP